MNFIDTHTHLFTEQFDTDRSAAVERAIESGITKMLLPNIDLESIESMHQLVKDFPEHCFPMMGLHPCSVTENWEAELTTIKGHLDSNTYCAVGEIGMDLYWDKSTLVFQQKAFAQQIEWAKEMKLPVAIHVRDAFDETFEIIDQLNNANLTGVFHCFTGTVEQAEHILNYGGFKLGIGGVLTFKNSGLDKVISEIDLNHLILETDSPYLATTPHRGKRNESDYITLIASKLAEVKNVSIETIAEMTSRNALELFQTVK
jgi:TatD DNase family protein